MSRRYEDVTRLVGLERLFPRYDAFRVTFASPSGVSLVDAYAVRDTELAVNVCSTPMPLVAREHFELCHCLIHLQVQTTPRVLLYQVACGETQRWAYVFYSLCMV